MGNGSTSSAVPAAVASLVVSLLGTYLSTTMSLMMLGLSIPGPQVDIGEGLTPLLALPFAGGPPMLVLGPLLGLVGALGSRSALRAAGHGAAGHRMAAAGLLFGLMALLVPPLLIIVVRP